MGSMIVTCPHCGLKTLTTHSVCLHCDRSLGDFAAPSTVTPAEEQIIRTGPITPLPTPPPREPALQTPPPIEPLAAEAGPTDTPPIEFARPRAEPEPEEVEEPAEEPRPEDRQPGEPTPPPGVRRRRLMRPKTEDTEDDEVWPPRGKAAQMGGMRPMRRIRQAKPHRTHAEDVPQIKPMRRGTCPSGHGHLSPGNIGDYPVQHCKTCHSIWVSHEVFRQFLLLQARQVLADGTIPPLGRRDLTQPPDDRPPVLCPQCTRPMHRHPHRLIPSVPLDICEDHGIWLRDKELQAVMRHIGQSGQDVAHRLIAALEG